RAHGRDPGARAVALPSSRRGGHGAPAGGVSPGGRRPPGRSTRPRGWSGSAGPTAPPLTKVSTAMPRAAVLILDFGSQYTQLIARRVRELGVYSEIVPGTTPVAGIRTRKPSALILSGSPASGYRAEAPVPDAGIYALGLPLLGICYGLQV